MNKSMNIYFRQRGPYGT